MQEHPFKHISVLIMPTDYCNMNCVYCFNDRRSGVKNKTMSLDILRRIFEITIPFYDDIKFIWHGGEPVSMGRDFYQKAIELQKEININNAKITNSIQSNLTLLDDDFVELLIENKFSIGGSFDGTQNEHTRHNSDKIIKGQELISKHGGKVGFICVVQKKNIDHLIEDYKWFRDKGLNYTLNIYMAEPPYDNNELFVPAEYFIEKVCELFDYWMYDTRCNIKLAYFEHYIKYILFREKSLCCYSSCLGKYVGIQYNGDIFNCNRTFSSRYSYGNINDYTDIRECFESKGFENTLIDAIERRNSCKKNCEIYDFCLGGCNSNALMSGNMKQKNEYLCEIMVSVYKHIENRIASLLSKMETVNDTSINPSLLNNLLKYKSTNHKTK